MTKLIADGAIRGLTGALFVATFCLTAGTVLVIIGKPIVSYLVWLWCHMWPN